MYKFRFTQKSGFVAKISRKFRFALALKGFLKKNSVRNESNSAKHKRLKGMHLEKYRKLFITYAKQWRFPDVNLRSRKLSILRRGVRTDFIHDGTFQSAIAPVLVMAQFFCLMPVRGVRSKNAKGITFRWRSFRTAYCMLYVVCTIVDTALTWNMVIHKKLDVRNIEPFIFHCSILLASIGFLRLAAKWPKLMQSWQKVERQMPKYFAWRERESLAARIRMVTIVSMILSLTEHLLSTISAIHFANYCPNRPDPIESYFVTVNSQLFEVFNYNIWLAWFGKIQNTLMTFGWSYMDLFVSIIGMGLSALFRRVQVQIDHVQGQPMPEAFWTRSREQYRVICELIEEVDAVLSGITMLSFSNNLYFVCIQLLKSINKMPSVAHAVYFYFSLMFLLARTLAVSLYLAEVNDASLRPLAVMKFIPEEAYYDEVERFAREVSTDVIALSGLKFFNITRKLVLTVAGTILTYELVLLQFHEDQKLWHCGSD